MMKSVLLQRSRKPPVERVAGVHPITGSVETMVPSAEAKMRHMLVSSENGAEAAATTCDPHQASGIISSCVKSPVVPGRLQSWQPPNTSTGTSELTTDPV